MRHPRRDRTLLPALPVAVLTLIPSLATADGDSLRLSEQDGNYRITVFSSPSPPRAGPVDVSVLVQDAATGDLASGMRVAIDVAPRGCPGVASRHPATTEAATNKLYYAATLDLPEPGSYLVEVSVNGDRGGAQVRFEMGVAEPLPPWQALVPWVGWPILAVLLFCIHQLLVRRRSG